MKKALFYLFGLCMIFSSCEVQQYATDNTTTSDTTDNSFKTKWLYIKCFQTLSNTSDYSYCLANDSDWDVYFIINFTCPGKDKYEIYYDKKNMNGSYVFVGTYTYENKESGTKTVPAYMPADNFQELYFNHRNYLKRLLDYVLSYNIIKE